MGKQVTVRGKMSGRGHGVVGRESILVPSWERWGRSSPGCGAKGEMEQTSRKEELSLQSGEPPEEAPFSLSTQCGLQRISVKHPQTPGQLRTDHQTQDS